MIQAFLRWRCSQPAGHRVRGPRKPSLFWADSAKPRCHSSHSHFLYSSWTAAQLGLGSGPEKPTAEFNRALSTSDGPHKPAVAPVLSGVAQLSTLMEVHLSEQPTGQLSNQTLLPVSSPNHSPAGFSFSLPRVSHETNLCWLLGLEMN
ncbi:mCG1049218 [Mus musculus]|nr:mCG1049218 [Mus musculus]